VTLRSLQITITVTYVPSRGLSLPSCILTVVCGTDFVRFDAEAVDIRSLFMLDNKEKTSDYVC